VSIDPTGIVSAVYTNGRSTQLGQLAIANFPNPQGLQQLGDTNWAQTFTSGTVVQGTAGLRRIRQRFNRARWKARTSI
jgi:flagellar hook protein FlgE